MKKTITYIATALFVAMPALASADTTVYNAIPDPLAPNYPSQPFQAQQTNEFGDYVHLGGTDRLLNAVTVTLSDWALASTPANVTFCAANGANCDATGFFWPITVKVYSSHLDANGIPDTVLASKTVNTHILWRPESDASCAGGAYKGSDNNCYNGFASNVTFDLSSLNVTLPDDVIVTFAYNTQTYGAAPTGVDGPYNSLNIAVPPTDPATVGSDDSADKVFWNTSLAGNYTNHACAGNALCEDSSWTPNGTVAMKITTVTPAASTVKVTIAKYVGNVHATAANTGSASFPMMSSWNATNIGSGSGTYALSSTGFNNPTAYEATTADMTSGASYSTNEDTSGSTVGASCADGKPYALTGYSTGSSLAAAQSATKSTTSPSLSNITSDQYIIVWNSACIAAPVNLSPANGATLTTATWTKADWTDVSDPFTPISYFYESSNSNATNPDGSFTTPAYQSGALSISEIPTTGTAAGTWYWHARAQDANSNTSPWSAYTQVIIDNTPTSTAPSPTACDTPGAAPTGYTLRNGTSGNDNVTLAPFTMFVGMGGNDKVTGANGNFIICGGTGNAQVTLGNGDNAIVLGTGNQKVTVGNGKSVITTGTSGNSTITTGNGDKKITTGMGNDTITTGNGDDTINAGDGNNTVSAGAGKDTITAGSGNDKVDGGTNTDSCNAGAGHNTVTNCE